MNSYLIKKITITNAIFSVAWSENQGMLAIGGSNGYLKVIKLEQKQQGSYNTPLQYHKGNVYLLSCNDKFRKLTIVDNQGVIIVWMMHQGRWVEQMINNRNISTVADMKWSPDGQKICIIYADGAIIMGSVQGSRLWGKQEKKQFTMMQWFPDSNNILIGSTKGQIFIYDQVGDLISNVKLQGLQKIVPPENYLCPNIPLAALQWFKQSKFAADAVPTGLCIAYKLGRIILMKHQRDDQPVGVDSNMQILQVRWNPSGTILAVSGMVMDGEDKKGIVKFFDDQGNFLKNLKLPNAQKIDSIAWQGSGSKMAIAYGQSVIVASIKLSYNWAYLSNDTLVVAHQKIDKLGFSIIFWNIKSSQKIVKFVKDLIKLKACDQFIAMFYKGTQDNQGRTRLQLCNSVGTPIQTKYIGFEANLFDISKTHIVAANQSYIYLWHYKTSNSKGMLGQSAGLKKIGRQISWCIDQKPTQQLYDINNFNHQKQVQDIILAIACKQNCLYVGKQSGVVQRFILPHLSQQSKLFIKSLPLIIQVNCDNTKLAAVDINGILNIMEINSAGGSISQFQKKDVWSVKWAQDHPNQIAFFQKNKLTIMHNMVIQKHLLVDAYICNFKDLKVNYLFLQDIMRSPDGVLIKQQLFGVHQSQMFKQFIQLLNSSGANQAIKFAQANQHPSLWKIVAQKAMNSLDFRAAQRALLKIGDFKGTKLIKRIQLLDDKQKQRAQVMAYYGHYDQAQQIYRSLQRKDLAVQLRMKVGDWFKVSQMVKQGSGYDDILLKVNNQMGYYYMDRMQWSRAAQCFILSKNYKQLVQVFVNMQDYDSLAQIITQLPQNDPILLDLAQRFKLVGMANYAVKCYQRCGKHKDAIDCCVLLNHWDIAVQLAQKYKFVQIQGLLNQTAHQLLQSNRKLQAAQLYRKANRNTQSAKILSNIADDLIATQSSPLTIKKLYVMAALQVDSYKKRILDQTMTGQNVTTAKTLDSLITSDINTTGQKILNNPWRGAQAWHFFILCQKQLYARQYKNSLKTAIRLSQYQLQLDSKKIYSLLALAAYYNKSFKQCSRAFFKLQGLPGLLQQQKQRYQQIAVQIFTRHAPRDSPSQTQNCPGKGCKAKVTQYDTHCKICGSNFQPCVLSGRSLLTKQYYTCKSCRHKMYQAEVQKIQIRHCALCHTPIDYKRFGVRDHD